MDLLLESLYIPTRHNRAKNIQRLLWQFVEIFFRYYHRLGVRTVLLNS